MRGKVATFAARSLPWLLPLVLSLLGLISVSHAYLRGAVWAAAMLVAFEGWGAALAWVLPQDSSRRAIDTGLRLAWGFAFTLLLGGIACMVHVGSRPFLLAQVFTGCVIRGLMSLFSPKRHISTRRLRSLWGKPVLTSILLLAFGLAACEFVLGLGTLWSNLSDDEPLYYFLPEKILQTGSPYDPYDVRRLTSYGGQFYLHAQFLVFGTHRQLNVVDAGIGTILVFAQIASEALRATARRKRALTAIACVLALVLLFTIDSVRFNIGSLMTALAAILGAHRTWLWVRSGWFASAGPFAHGQASTSSTTASAKFYDYFLVAMCVVAACVLRTSCAVPVVAFVGLSLVEAAYRLHPGRRVAEIARHLALFGASFAACLVAWLALYRQSSGTLIYPISHGNMTPGFAILKVEPGLAFNFEHIKNDFLFSKPITTSLVFMLSALLPVSIYRRRAQLYRPSMTSDARLLAVVVVLSMIFTSVLGGAFAPDANARYYFAFLMWLVLATTLGMWDHVAHGWRALGPRALAVGAAVSIHAVSMWGPLRVKQDDVRAAARVVRYAKDGDPLGEAPVTRAYREAQLHIPAGAPAVVTVADPFRFNLRRNEIMSLDLAGGMGEAPGFPCFQGPEGLANYLMARGINYIITVPYTRTRGLELYNLDTWRRHLTAYRSFLIYEAPFVVDAMNSIVALQVSRKIAYRNEELTVIDLRTRAF